MRRERIGTRFGAAPSSVSCEGRSTGARWKQVNVRWTFTPPSGLAKDGQPWTFERSGMRSEERGEQSG